jgi:alkanesulfonate monooxygenase SsuD/methylene tetrahydromethanopterin reductase-like flavin-dependent oxidoreductase (luciferase family)
MLDQMTGPMATAEPLTMLSYVAALTSRVRLGVAVLIAALRGPVAAAKSISTLDWLSDGRVDIGLGLGPVRTYPAHSVDPAAGGGPGAILDEFIAILELLWANDIVDFEGRTWSIEGASVNPKPRQLPRPPLWIGGSSDASLRRAIRLGGGWIGAGRHTSAEFAVLVERLRALQSEASSSVDLTVSKRVYLVIDDDQDAADRAVRDWFGLFYGRPHWGPPVSVFGSVADVRAEIEQLVAAGANHLLLHPLVDDLDQYRRVTNEVIAPMAAGE